MRCCLCADRCNGNLVATYCCRYDFTNNFPSVCNETIYLKLIEREREKKPTEIYTFYFIYNHHHHQRALHDSSVFYYSLIIIFVVSVFRVPPLEFDSFLACHLHLFNLLTSFRIHFRFILCFMSRCYRHRAGIAVTKLTVFLSLSFPLTLSLFLFLSCSFSCST